MRHGRAEDAHDRITDEFLHESFDALDGLGHFPEQVALQRAHLFGIQPLAERGEPRQIGEQNGDGAAVRLRVGGNAGGANGARRLRRPRCRLLRRRTGKPRAALRAERKVGGGLEPAGGTVHCT